MDHLRKIESLPLLLRNKKAITNPEGAQMPQNCQTPILHSIHSTNKKYQFFSLPKRLSQRKPFSLICVEALVQHPIREKLRLTASQTCVIQIYQEGLALIVLPQISILQGRPCMSFIDFNCQCVVESLHKTVLAHSLQSTQNKRFRTWSKVKLANLRISKR